ncbi:MAG: oligosaccharide flippase family protein [Lachnospiraceae bacterium]|nr:oligosaccharide flippase family protein [Lachnospiraceae bacterium]
MNKFKLFIENFIVYGFGGVISKIIPLIMVPIVVKMLPSEDYYGISDMSNTIISFASAIAIMGMYDAMYRMFFDKEDEGYKKEICSTTVYFTFVMSIIVFTVMILARKFLATVFLKDINLNYVIFISAFATLVGATNGIISAPTRMQNKRGVFLILNTVGPIISYSIAIPLILKGHYIIALPLAFALSNFSLECVFAVLNRKWFSIKSFRKEYLKPLLLIAVPLIPNFLVYWIFNSCDRLMITNLLSLGDDGIYAVGSKLGMASQLIYTAFAGGWQFFAFSVMKEKDQVDTNSKIFEYLGVISFAGFSFICVIAYPLFYILFKDTAYLAGFIISPYLFLAPLLQMLFQVEANQFLVIKKTWPNLFILSSGAVFNLIMNFVLIPKIGIEGAAIATLAGYIITDIICTVVLIKMKLMTVSVRFIIACLLCCGYFALWRVMSGTNILVNVISMFALLVLYCVMYNKELKNVYLKAKGLLKRKDQ